MADILEYTSHLNEKVRSEGPKRKGARTRDRLKIATAKLLNETSYQDLRVTDICDKANVAPGTFYLYFENKQVLTIEILSEFVEMFDRDVRHHSHDPFESIYRSNLLFIQMARSNPGLFRCILQMSDVEPDFARVHQRINGSWYAKVVAAMTHWVELPSRDAALLSIHALGSMMDDVVRRLFVMQDPYLIEVIDALKFDDEAIAEHLSVIWYRAIFGADPPLAKKTIASRFPKLGTKSSAKKRT